MIFIGLKSANRRRFYWVIWLNKISGGACMTLQKIYKAAIYVRLSKEDGDVSSTSKSESDSISNQKDLIRDFLKDRPDIEIVSERIDDGYSGVNFQRPAFQLMLEDIRQGKVDCVVVKDLSRFGRNYIESGRYIEQLFPMLGVRFIAITDNYDSIAGRSQTDEIIIPFKNLTNDAYCRDISIKIRSHLDTKRRKGEFIASFTIYGYKKSPQDKNRIIVDDYAAGVVKNIFSWKIGGMSQQGIADKLNDTGILSPAEYKKSCGINYHAHFQTGSKALWSAVAVTRILANECYTGTLIQGKYTTPNYKVKKTVNKSEEEWVRICDAFEAIITKEEFELVQRLLKRDTRVAPNRESVYLFSGIAVCGDCGRQMSRKVSTVAGKKYVYYMCSANKKEGQCSGHRIRESKLEEAVTCYLNCYIDQLADMKAILEYIETLPLQGYDIKRLETRIEQLEKEAKKCERLKIAAYEDMDDGVVSKDEYISLKQEFDSRKKNALSSIAQINLEIGRIMQREGKHHEWIETFLKKRGIEKLIRNAAVELIEQIRIYEDKRIEVRFRYADKYQSASELIGHVLEDTHNREDIHDKEDIHDRKDIHNMEEKILWGVS